MREGWVETTLGEVALLNPSEPTLSNTDHFAPMDAVHVGKRWLQYTEERRDRNGARARAGDILFARITPCLENGKVAQVQSELERCGGSTEFIVVRGTEKCTSDFLYFWCTLKVNRDKAAELMTGTTGRQRLSWQDLGRLTLWLPPLPEQKRIVDLISSVDSYLESLRTALASSVSARKSALESQLESLNETSPVFRLEELCASGKSAIVDGPFGANLKREDYLEQGIPVLKIQNIKQDFVVVKKMDFVSESKYHELRRHSFQKNDIVMTKLGDPLGLSAIVRELDKGLIVADLVRIRPDKIDVEFLCMQLNSAKIQNYINRMQKGSTRPRVNLGMIREMPITVPSENEIDNLVSVFGIWSEQNRKLEETIQSTEQLRSGLLSDLLSGEHEIPASYDMVIGAA